MSDCIFCKIASKQIPVDVVYEDDYVIVFKDISPQAPVHLLVIPKKHIPTVQDLTPADSEVIHRIWTTIPQLADQFELADRGYRIVANCGEDGGQTVFHLHFHLLGGREMNWPPG